MLFLEFTEEPTLDNRAALKAMEQMAVDAQTLTAEDRRELCSAFRANASNFDDPGRDFVFDLPTLSGSTRIARPTDGARPERQR